MLFCSCPVSDQTACSERRRQTIVPVCSYEEKQMPNCLELQATCKTNYICRSRLADFFVNCMSEPRSLSGCLKENYADCLLSYSGLIGTVMTPNYLRSPKISVSPYCDCTNSGNNKDDCDKFTEFFTENTCLRKFSQPAVQFYFVLNVAVSYDVFYFHPLVSLALYPALHSYPLFYFLLPTKYIPLQRLGYYPTAIQRNQSYCTAVCALYSCAPVCVP
ncbi:GDNF receptor alpha-1 [Xenoophorus captivus]|uniref:GDNF receptor alpha-1 n=1 Tax=Xenoophorus captivus TaxID=1517983 RepID=A0ABV0QQY6_9TELE